MHGVLKGTEERQDATRRSIRFRVHFRGTVCSAAAGERDASYKRHDRRSRPRSRWHRASVCLPVCRIDTQAAAHRWLESSGDRGPRHGAAFCAAYQCSTISITHADNQ